MLFLPHWYLVITLFLVNSCTDSAPSSSQNSIQEVVQPTPNPPADPTPVVQEAVVQNAAAPETAAQPQAAPAETPSVQSPIASNKSLEATKPSHHTPPVSPDCHVHEKFPNDEPVFLPKTKVMLTRLTAPCTTVDGKLGHLPTAGWMVMGFPCTGGEGRIDWKGTNYNAPKMVSFLLDTACAMAPTDPTTLKKMVTDEMGLNHSANMIAFNPFMIQYWEFPGFDDADATFAVDLRSGKSLSQAWGQFIKEKPLSVTLVGRENAWVSGNYIYQLDAELVWASKNRFRLKVKSARVLKGEDLAAIKSRCEALRPERECGKVF